MATQALGAGAGALLCAGPQVVGCAIVGGLIGTGILVGGWLLTRDDVESADRAADRDLAPAIPDTACASCRQNPCAHLACGVPGSTYRGGAHWCMQQPTGDGKHSHHMPARSISPLPSEIGPSIQMDPRDHRRTNSYGSSPASNAVLAQQQQMIAGGGFVAAQAIDVGEVMALFPGKYDAAIAQMEAYTACLKQTGQI